MFENFNPVCTYRFIYKQVILVKIMEEKYVMFSMDDDRIKYLSESLSNPSCKKILDLLSEQELTETDIAKQLKIPLNTVDYNIKKLIKAGLIEKTSHFWSIRGKKMPVYKVSNKQIIISPKKFTKINTFVASLLGTGLISLIIKKYTESPIQEEFYVMQDVAMMSTERSIETSTSLFFGLAGWQWFLAGAWLGIILFFMFSTIIERRKTK